jgi:hypothetical protein
MSFTDNKMRNHGKPSKDGAATNSLGEMDLGLIADLFGYPRLRENLWQIGLDSPHSLVETTDNVYEVPTPQALAFLQIRSHCTGHNSITEIGVRSGVAPADVMSILLSLAQAGITRPQVSDDGIAPTSLDQVREKLQKISAIWSRELAREFVANELLSDSMPKTVLFGWLLETYHYVKDFPEAIAVGARQAEGVLRTVLERYVAQETGHEHFVMQTLLNLGLTSDEVRASRPLVSTRLISLLMRELFAFEPVSVLLVASVIEAQELPTDDVDGIQSTLEARYGLARGSMAPYFEHQMIDARLGHSNLLADNLALFQVTDEAVLDQLVDKLHDLKHAFELQSKEIKMYYSDLGGKYFPRQAVTFSAL